MQQKVYPRSKDKETVYLKNVITNPNIIIGDYTMYNDFVREPCRRPLSAAIRAAFPGQSGPY